MAVIADEPKTAVEGQAKTLAIVTIACGVIIAIGSVMPWVTVNTVFGSMSANGTDGDGMLTLILGVVIAVTGIVRLLQGRSMISIVTGIIATIAAAAIAINTFSNLADVVGVDDFASSSIGIGLWVVAIGVIGSFVGTFGGLSR